MIGNKNAEKWTEESVNDLLLNMLDHLKESKCYYVGWLLDDFDLPPSWWSYVEEKFSGTSVSEALKGLEQKLEKNLVKAMLEGTVKETTGIFTLKSKHGWRDKQEHHYEVDPIQVNLNLRND